jgi:hypothetical protein
MPAERVSDPLLNRTANFLALVLLAGLQLPAQLLALELVFDVLHEVQPEMLRVVYLIAGYKTLVLPTTTGLLY